MYDISDLSHQSLDQVEAQISSGSLSTKSFNELTIPDSLHMTTSNRYLHLIEEIDAYEYWGDVYDFPEQYDLVIKKEEVRLGYSDISAIEFIEDWYVDETNGGIRKEVVGLCLMRSYIDESGTFQGFTRDLGKAVYIRLK